MLLIILFSIIPLPDTAIAIEGSTDSGTVTLHFVTKESDPDADPSTYGDLTFTTDSKAATTNIKFQTTGWMIRKADLNGSYDGPVCTSEDKLSAQCSPTFDGNAVEIDSSSFTSNVVPGAPTGRVWTKFVMKASDVAALFALNPVSQSINLEQ